MDDCHGDMIYEDLLQDLYADRLKRGIEMSRFKTDSDEVFISEEYYHYKIEHESYQEF